MSKTAILKAAFEVINRSGASRLLASHWGGRGVIFCLHHVVPGGGLQQGFAPNNNLEITPEFLEVIISLVKANGYELLSLDDAVTSLESRSLQKSKCAVFTLDDGYKDNLIHAMPVFQRHSCPFTVYVAPRIADGTCELWWRGLEAIIAQSDQLDVQIGSEVFKARTESEADKWKAWHALAPLLQNMPEYEQREWIAKQAESCGVDLLAICRSAAMTWDEIREMHADPLCTIGAHTLNHYNLLKLSDADCRHEMVASRKRIEKELNAPVQHFAYPYGNKDAAGPREFNFAREAGYRSSVVTRLGILQSEHAQHLQALPRVMVSGRYQKPQYIEALISGIPGRLANRLRGVSVD